MSLYNAFLVTTFNRPDTCLRLLQSIEEVYKGTQVVVVDDASSEDYTKVKELVEARKWTWVQHTENHGRMRYVQTVNDGLAVFRGRSFSKLYFLQDDVNFTPEMFADAENLWSDLPVRSRGSLVLYTPTGVKVPPEVSDWTNKPMVNLLPELADEVHHIDTSAILSRAALAAINYTIPLPDPVRFARSHMSSGFGMGISTAFASQNYRMYRSLVPLVETMQVASQMHPAERLSNPRNAAASTRYLYPVIATMATFPGRADCLPSCVASLLPQVDKLYVWCNEMTEVPECLKNPKIVARLADRDLADNGKFAFDADLGSSPVYHFTCDDDLIYPPDYVARLVLVIETSKRQSVVSAHGRMLPERKISDFYKDTTPVHCLKENTTYRQVDFPGTGVMAYCTSLLRFSLDDFPHPKMADVYAGLRLLKDKISAVCIPHKAEWLKVAYTESPCIFNTEYGKTQRQVDAINAVHPWVRPATLHPGVSYSGLVYWQHYARARNKACVVPEEWSYTDAARHRPALEKFIRRMVETVPAGKTILDFGCGFGRWANVLKAAGLEYKGVDISKEVLGLDPDPSRSVWVFGEPLPRADVIFVFDVLAHIPPSDVEKLPALFKEAAPQLVLIERHRAVGVEGKERSNYDTLFKGISDCDSVQTHRIIWQGYRGKLK